MSAQTVSLKITLRYKDVDEFAKRYAENISSAGLFLRTRTPKPTGSKIRFELLLSDGSHVLRGDGVVVNIRQDEKPGMAIRFNVLDGESWANVEKVVALHGNGALAPTPLGAPFRTVAPAGGASSSRRVRTSLRAGGVGKGTGPIRSPFAGSSAPIGASWSAPPPPRESQVLDAGNEDQEDVEQGANERPSMLSRPWATGRQADIDTSEIRTARISQFGQEDDKLEVPLPVDADVPDETVRLSPAEFLSRATELRKRVASTSQGQKSDSEATEQEKIDIAPPLQDEASQLAKSLAEGDAVDKVADGADKEASSEKETISPPEPVDEQESTSSEQELPGESEKESSVELSNEDESFTPNVEELAESQSDEAPIASTESDENADVMDAGLDDDDWASAFDDFPDSSLPTKIVTPADPVPDESFLAALEGEADEGVVVPSTLQLDQATPALEGVEQAEESFSINQSEQNLETSTDVIEDEDSDELLVQRVEESASEEAAEDEQLAEGNIPSEVFLSDFGPSEDEESESSPSAEITEQTDEQSGESELDESVNFEQNQDSEQTNEPDDIDGAVVSDSSEEIGEAENLSSSNENLPAEESTESELTDESEKPDNSEEFAASQESESSTASSVEMSALQDDSATENDGDEDLVSIPHDELGHVPSDFDASQESDEAFPATYIRLKSPDAELTQSREEDGSEQSSEIEQSLDGDWSAFADTPGLGDPAAPPLSEVLSDTLGSDDESAQDQSELVNNAAEELHGFVESSDSLAEGDEPNGNAEFESGVDSDLPLEEPTESQPENEVADESFAGTSAESEVSADDNLSEELEAAASDSSEPGNDGLDNASESELSQVVDNLFEVESDEAPLPKLRASVPPDLLDSPPLIDEVVEKAVQAERESTGEFAGLSNEVIELAASESEQSLENLLQARSVVREDSDLEESPPVDFAMHEAQTMLAHESVSDEELNDSSTKIKSDELSEENPNRLSMDVAGAFEGASEATMIEGSAEDYLSSLPSPAKIETIEPPANLAAEVIPNRPISAETKAEPNQEHWTHSEIERGYSVDISSHIQSTRPKKEATVAIDLGGQWLRVVQNQNGSMAPIQIEGLTHYPALIGLYENYEVAQGAELLQAEQSSSLEIVSVMQLLRVLQGEPYASNDYAGKVREEPNGRCIAELIGKKWNLSDVLQAFFSPVGASINEALGNSKTWVKLIVPAGTNDQVKGLLLDACEGAGLGVYDFVHDVDAILAGAANAISGLESLLFVDLGHTHLSAYLAVNSESGWSVLSTAWDGNVSAELIDRRVAQSIVTEMSGSWSDLTIGQRDLLTRVASSVRGDSSKDPSISFTIPDQRGLNEQVITLPRTRAYQSSEEFIDKVIVMMRGLANAASIHPKTLGGVIILGGSSRFQPLVSAITTLTTKQPLAGVNPDLCPVAGALGLSEAALQGDSSGNKITLTSAIGVALPGGRFKTLIDAGSTLPAEVVRRNPTSKDNQSVFELELFQGSGSTVEDCEPLGRVVLPGLPKGARGAVFVDLKMKLQKDGVIRVHLSEPHSGEKAEASFATQQTLDEKRAEIEKRNEELGVSGAKSKSRKSLLGRLFGR